MADEKLSDRDLGYLREAGRWGLLRDLDGRTVCLTGKMSLPRAQVEKLIEAADGRFTNTMTGAVQILVTADPDSRSTKVQAAMRAGIPVLSEAQFVTRLMPSPDELLTGERARFEAW